MVRSALRWLLFLGILAWLAPLEAGVRQDESQAEEVARLVKLLQSPDAALRLAAAAGLGDMAVAVRQGRIEERSKTPLPALRETAAPELAKLVGDPVPAVRRQAVLALGMVSAPGKVASPVWLDALKDPDAGVRRAVPPALLAYLARVKEISNLLRPTDELSSLKELVVDLAETKEPIQACLLSSDPAAVKTTMDALDGFIDSIEATPEVSADDQAEGRPFREALPKAAEALRSLLGPITKALLQPPTDNQRRAASLLEKLARICDPRLEVQTGTDVKEPSSGGRAKPVRGRIVRKDLGAEGAEALRILKAGLMEVLPALVKLVNQPPICVQLAVLDTLEVLGVEAKPAVPAIRVELLSGDPFVRWAAARALAEIGPVEDNLPTVLGLARLTSDEDLDVASSACDFLGSAFAKDAAPAVPALSLAAQSEERDVQYAAVGALRLIVNAIGPAAREAVPGLIVALASKDQKTRQAVPPILGQLGAEAQAALPALEKALDDSDLEVRVGASNAILKIRGQ